MYRALKEGGTLERVGTCDDAFVLSFVDGFNRPHRAGGPAMVYFDGDGKVTAQYWYLNGRRHRIGGPASIAIDLLEWWENGRLVKESSQLSLEQVLRGDTQSEDVEQVFRTHFV